MRGAPHFKIATIVLLAVGALHFLSPAPPPPPPVPAPKEVTFSCLDPYVVDGDTLHCAGRRVRLNGIDAPEMPEHCVEGRHCTPGNPFAARKFLTSLVKGKRITCHQQDKDSYGRSVALCKTDDGTDLSCAMVKSGHAVRRYAPLDCSSPPDSPPARQ